MRPRAGFTLVEVLLSLLIFSFLAAAGVSVLTTMVASREAIRDADQRLSGLGRLHRALQLDLGAALNRDVRDARGETEAAFRMGLPGQPTLLALTRTGSDAVGPGREIRPMRIEYRLVEDRLERRVSDRLDGGQPDAAQILIRGVTSAALTPLGAGGADWTASPEQPLPKGLRFDVVIDGIGETPQTFLVAP